MTPPDQPKVDPPFPSPSAIEFYAEDRPFDLPDPKGLRSWITETINREGGQLGALSFIFCSDDFLHDINVRYLQHDTYTDIITFPYARAPKVEGDIFVSLDRVAENAKAYGVAFEQELYRVMIHGVLHLCGFADQTPEEKEQMRAKEDEALQRLPPAENR